MGCGTSTDKTGFDTPKNAGARRVFLRKPSDGQFLRTLSETERQDKKRILAFRNLLGEGDGFVRTDKLERLVRAEGTPSLYRWAVWKALTGSEEIYRTGILEQILRHDLDAKVLSSINNDLHRTFPGRDDFDEKQQEQLSQICKAFAALNPEIGYVQGMNYIAGFLLLVSDSTEDAFFVFLQLMARYSMSLLFHDGLPLLKLYTFQFARLLEQLLPDVNRHFAEQCITPELYVTKWILTLFTHSLTASEEGSEVASTSPMARLARIWDLLLCDGLQSIVLVALASVKLLRKRILALDMEDIVELLRFQGLPQSLASGSAIVKTALEFKLPNKVPMHDHFLALRQAWVNEQPADAAVLEQASKKLQVACGSPFDVLQAFFAPAPLLREAGRAEDEEGHDPPGDRLPIGDSVVH